MAFRFPILIFSALALLATTAFSNSLPFLVKIGGEEAKLEKETDIAAKLKSPVAADAELEVAVEGELPMLLINAFTSNPSGEINEESTPIILVGQNTKKIKLDATLDHKKLDAGFYILSIVAGENTARVLIKVK